MPLLSFLPVSIKEYAYAAIAAALLAFGVYERAHLINEGEQKIEAADAKVAAAAKIHDADVTALAQSKSTTIGEIYEKAVRVPAVADLGVVCHAPDSGSVPEAAGSIPSSAGAALVVGGGPAFDPTGPALTIGREDDAMILALQNQVQVLMDAMNGSTK